MEMPGFSAFTTVFTAASTAIITSILIPTYWTPYVDFKKELIMTNRYLQLHSDILYNKFQRNSSNSEFEKKVHDAQYDIRIAWANLESKYLLIPSCIKPIFITLKKIPTKKEMEYISDELLSISNSMIIFDETDSQQAKGELRDRQSSIYKIKEYLKKYGIS